VRKFLHYGKIALFLVLIVSAYAAVVVSVVCYSDPKNFPLAASLIAAGVAVITSLLALLKDMIMEAINRPRLVARFLPYDKRDCHATAFRDINTGALLAKAHYFRLRIENVGWRTADDVEVTLEEVKRFENNRFLVDPDFMPLRLFWSHWRESRYEISIPPDAYRHCDFGFILEPTVTLATPSPTENGVLLFWFDVFRRPNTGRTSLLPGRYQITVSAFGKNVGRSSLRIELEWKGLWDDDIDVMLRDSLLPRNGFETT
jgi:hypothetical protein